MPQIDSLTPEPLRISVLWYRMADYWQVCFEALRLQGAEVSLTHGVAIPDAPFDDDDFDVGRPAYRWETAPDEQRIRKELEKFEPHVLLVSSWNVGAYRRASREWRGRALRILCMDNQWLGTPKQWGGRLLSPSLIRPTYDAAFLPGERSATFARYLGFRDEEILWGFYTCDDTFADIRDQDSGPVPHRFLYVGRLVPEKNIDVLAAAYREYSSRANDPWPLLVCGTGPLASSLANLPGVEMAGFVQRQQLREAYENSGCLVLPSTYEPWGVAIHEAASAGLAVIASTACGAASRLVLDGYNGVLVSPDRTGPLVDAFEWMSNRSDSQLARLSEASRGLARQFTPERWASYLIEKSNGLRDQLGLSR